MLNKGFFSPRKHEIKKIILSLFRVFACRIKLFLCSTGTLWCFRNLFFLFWVHDKSEFALRNDRLVRFKSLKPMSPLKAKHTILAIYLCIAIIVSCATIEGKSITTYHSDYQTTVRASSDALESLEIPVLEEVSDELKTKFLARRSDGIPVTVEVTRVDRNFTRVTVHTGAGIDRYLDREVSRQIHGFIRGRLSQH